MRRTIHVLIAAALTVGVGAFGARQIASGQSEFRLEFDAGAAQHLPKEDIGQWLRQSYSAVRHYYGRFPLSELVILIHDEDGDDVGFGSTTWEHGHGLIEINIGDEISKPTLMHAWTATHEMTHLAMPILPHSERWVAEGMATYIEPLARLQVGQLKTEDVWGDMVRNAQRGIGGHRNGFRGTHSISEMYWGGAIWCLLADIQIREKTNNRFGFQDAMRAIVKAHATADSDYSAEQALRFGDEAVGVAVLVPMYKQFSDGPIDVNLLDLWHRLGVVPSGSTVRFDDSAPLASIRRSIETGPK